MQQPLVCLGQGTQAYDLYQSFFAARGLLYAPDIQVATTGQILPLVQNGLGLGFVPERLGRQALEGSDLVAIRLTEPLPQRTASLVTDPAVPLGHAAKMLYDMLLAAAQGGKQP